MQVYQPAPKAWIQQSDDEIVSTPVRAAPATSSPAGELAEALAPLARGFGDAFVFGRCTEPYERALAQALPAEARVFGCAEGAARLRRGRKWLDAADFNEGSLQELRARHHVQRVSVLVVADDFTWSLGRVVHGLRSLVANSAALMIAGRHAALLETMWLDELRSGQSDFDVARMDAAAANWARFSLRRRHFV